LVAEQVQRRPEPGEPAAQVQGLAPGAPAPGYLRWRRQLQACSKEAHSWWWPWGPGRCCHTPPAAAAGSAAGAGAPPAQGSAGAAA
jgi:hypothetical protein